MGSPPSFARFCDTRISSIDNEDDKCFLWCHVQHLNPQEINPQCMKRTNKELAEQLNNEGIEFPVKA